MSKPAITTCGNDGQNLGLTLRKNCVRIAALYTTLLKHSGFHSVKAAFIPTSFRFFTPYSSPIKYSHLHLFEYIFYPVSTVSTITTTRLKS